jgi:hypothetical protein
MAAVNPDLDMKAVIGQQDRIRGSGVALVTGKLAGILE